MATFPRCNTLQKCYIPQKMIIPIIIQIQLGNLVDLKTTIISLINPNISHVFKQTITCLPNDSDIIYSPQDLSITIGASSIKPTSVKL